MPHIALLAQQTKAVQVRNIFCIGRNYAAHIAELGNRPEEDPVVFIKPTSALHTPGTPIVLPAHSGDVHYEAELVLLVGQGGKNIAEDKALKRANSPTWRCPKNAVSHSVYRALFKPGVYLAGR